MNPIISVENLTFAYKKRNPILSDVTFEVNRGEILGLTGLSGSGKTTLLYIMKGIIPHMIRGNLEGKIIVNQMETRRIKIAQLAKSVGMVFQDLNAQLFSNTVKEEIEFGLKNLKLDTELVKEAINELDLHEISDKSPMNLSMGQKQRVILASVIAMQPKILLLDEPTVHLDSKNKKNLLNWLKKINKTHSMNIIIASNNPWLIGNLCDDVLHIQNNQVERKPKNLIMEQRNSWGWMD